jgi:hypothetical protein
LVLVVQVQLVVTVHREPLVPIAFFQQLLQRVAGSVLVPALTLERVVLVVAPETEVSVQEQLVKVFLEKQSPFMAVLVAVLVKQAEPIPREMEEMEFLRQLQALL